MRNQFTFYKSFDDVIEDMTNNQIAEYVKVMLDVQFLRVKIDDVKFTDKTLSIVWKSQKHSVTTSIKGYLDSQKRETVKNPYLGVYDENCNPCEGVAQQDKEQEQDKEEEKGQEKEKKQHVVTIVPVIDYSLPLGTDKDLFNDFLLMRKKLKAPNTQRSINSLISILTEIMSKGFHPNDIIQTSYDNGWKSFFEPKQQSKQQTQPYNTPKSQTLNTNVNVWDEIDKQESLKKINKGLLNG